jgi:hypothetical protein
VCVSTQAASRPESLRAMRRARARRCAVDPPAAPARRGSPYCALTCRSLRHEANMPRRAHIGYKNPPLRLPPEHTAVRRPPLSSPPWARVSASFHRRPTIPTSSLDPSQASMVGRWPPPPRALPESAWPRACRRGLVATARRRTPRPHHRHQSARGELNRPPVSLVALVRPHLAAARVWMWSPGTHLKIRDSIATKVILVPLPVSPVH